MDTHQSFLADSWGDLLRVYNNSSYVAPWSLCSALPVFLFSASNLVELSLRNAPPSGYISPEALVTHVVALLRLEILDVEFISYPDLIPSPPITIPILPNLQSLSFTGDSDYLEDFVA